MLCTVGSECQDSYIRTPAVPCGIEVKHSNHVLTSGKDDRCSSASSLFIAKVMEGLPQAHVIDHCVSAFCQILSCLKI